MDTIISNFPILAGVFVGLAAVAWIAIGFVKRSNAKAPIVTRHGKIIEKVPGAIETLVVEFDDGKRERLVDTKRSTVYAVGDSGIFKTQKNSIVSFDRQ